MGKNRPRAELKRIYKLIIKEIMLSNLLLALAVCLRAGLVAAEYTTTTSLPLGYLPPVGTTTNYITNTITATECLTKDTFSSNTYEVINQQLVILTICTKDLQTDTVYRNLVTPVNDVIAISHSTQRLRPLTTTVTDLVNRFSLKEVTNVVTETLTHRAIEFAITTLTETRTETLTRATRVISTEVNARTHITTTTFTVFNTIVVDEQVPAPSFQGPAQNFQEPVPSFQGQGGFGQYY